MDDFFSGILCLMISGAAAAVPLLAIGMGVFSTQTLLGTRRQVEALERRLVLLEGRLDEAAALPAGGAARATAIEAEARPPLAVGVRSGVPAGDEAAVLPQAPLPVGVRSGVPAGDEAAVLTQAPLTSEAPERADRDPAARSEGPQGAAPALPPAPPMGAEAFFALVERSLVWIGGAMGALMLFLAAVFVLILSLDRGWFGPPMQVAGALTAGAGLGAAGAWIRRTHYRAVGSALVGTGLGVMYGALFAGASIYHLFPSGLSFALMVAVSGAALGGAIRQRSRFIAHLGLIGGVLTPVLLSSGQNQPLALFGYLALLVGGSIAGAAALAWWDLALVALLGAATLHLGWSLAWHQADQTVYGLGGALVLGGLFALLTRSRDLLTRGAGLLGVWTFMALSGLWLWPVGQRFDDAVNGLTVWNRGGLNLPLAAAALVALAVMGLAASRAVQRAIEARGAPWTYLGVAVPAATVLLLGWDGSLLAVWATHPWTSDGWILGSLLAIVGVAGLIVDRRSPLRGWVGVAPAVVGAVISGLVIADPGGPALLWGATGLVVVGGLSSLWAASGGAALGLLAGVSLPLLVGIALLGEEVSVLALGAPAVLAYALLSTAPLMRSRPDLSRMLTAILAPLALFLPLAAAWEEGLGDSLLGALPLLMGLNAILAAALLARRDRLPRTSGALAIFVGLGLAGVSLALPFQLQDAWLTVGWGLEVVALAWLSGRLSHRLLPWTAAALGVAVGVRLLANPWALAYGDTGGWPILNWTLYTWGLPALSLLVGAQLLAGQAPREGLLARVEGALPTALRLLAIGLGFALINVEVSHAFQDAGPVELGGHGLWQGMARSAGWATYGVGLLGLGLVARSRYVRLIGFGFVLLATVKVFVVDLWVFAGLVRVGSFACLGVSLLIAAFLFERLVLRRSEG
ncbi:MAG: DUF2339 domain-containing protein [Deltaproteobacteria bacterium]|nr:DUF2339 domain-containing protein [Deltaproteobacteria bacterium]